MIIVHTLVLLFFLFLLGLPVSALARQPNQSFRLLHWVLAPHLGLAVLVTLAINAYILNVPVSKTVLPIAGIALLIAIGMVLTAVRQRRADPAASAPPRPARWSVTLRIPLFLLVATFLIYALPFLINPSLVFYAYAGTDGYSYMSIAQHQINHGAWNPPALDLYHVYSGLVAPYTSIQNNYVDKPGTMMALAFFSSLFHSLPQEIFSCLMLAAPPLIFGAVFVLAQRLRYSPTASAWAAFLAAVSPSVLALSSNTYLAATMTLPFVPLVLIFTHDLAVSWRGAALAALGFSAFCLLSPPNMLIPLAMVALFLFYQGLRELLERRAGILGKCSLTLALLTLLNLLTGRFYLATLSGMNVFRGTSSSGILSFALSPASMDTAERRYSWNLFWHTMGVGPIIASPNTMLEFWDLTALVCVVLAALGYLVWCFRRKDFSILFFAYISFWLVVLIGGAAGVFHQYVVLGRVCQQFSSLHALVYVALIEAVLRAPARRWVLLLPVVLLAALYPFRIFYDFEWYALELSPSRTNQYRETSLRERRDIGNLVGNQVVLLSSVVPTYTGVANSAVLFSNLRLLLPPEYLKFYFLQDLPRPNNYYCAPVTLVPTAYEEIYDYKPELLRYDGAENRLYRNELIPLLDDDSFPIKYAFEAPLLRRYSFTQARILDRQTVIHVCSGAARTVRLGFRYTPGAHSREVAVAVNDSPGAVVEFGASGSVTTRPLRLSGGENRIQLQPASGGAPIDVLHIQVLDESP